MSKAYELTDEQKMVKDMVRRMAHDKIAPLSADIDETGSFPREIIGQFKDLGLFGLAFPEEVGGSDMGMLSRRTGVDIPPYRPLCSVENIYSELLIAITS